MMSQCRSDSDTLLPITALEGKEVNFRMDNALSVCVLWSEAARMCLTVSDDVSLLHELKALGFLKSKMKSKWFANGHRCLFFSPLQPDVASNDRNVGRLDSQAPVMCLFVCLKRKYLSMRGTQGNFFALTECFLPAESLVCHCTKHFTHGQHTKVTTN